VRGTSTAIFIPWRDLRLAARVFRPADHGVRPRAGSSAVLLIHGWSGYQDANDVVLGAALAEAGLWAMTFDLAGHGLSEGSPERYTLADFLDQACAAHDHLHAEVSGPHGSLAHRPVSVCGTSLGAYLGVLLSAERAVNELSLRVPAHYPDAMFSGIPVAEYVRAGQAWGWRSLALAPDTTRALRALQSFRGHLQIIEAARDEVIPRQTIVNYLQAAVRCASVQHVVLPEATHVIYEHRASRRDALRRVRAWIAERPGADQNPYSSTASSSQDLR